MNRMKIKSGAIIFLLFLSINTFAQKSRTMAMGNLSYSIIDSDYSINMFDIGYNPAWLIADSKDAKLEFTPNYTNSKYDFARKYSPESSDNYNIFSTAVKPLGNAGTFRGSASYNYLSMNNYNRTIELNPYTGKGFFYADTTNGDFTYKGPSFQLMHSLKLSEKIYIGGSVNYKVWDGLKEISSYAITTFRDVNLNVGVAYSLLDNLTLGTNFIFNSSQENIEINDPNNLSITIDNIFGENYSVRLITGDKNEKIRNSSSVTNFQIQWQPAINIDVLFTGSLENANSALLNSSSATFKDREDSYANFYGVNAGLISQYRISKEFIAGLKAQYNKLESWTKLSAKNLKIWDWETNRSIVGLGLSYNPANSDFLIGVEYEFSDFSADSSKYIDNKYNSISSIDHLVKIGAEYKLLSSLISRAGYNYQKVGEDLIFGAKDLTLNRFTLGLGIKLTEAFTLDFSVDYILMKPGTTNNNISNDIFVCSATLRTYTF